MKKLFFLFTLVSSLIVNAQVPAGFNYQAAVRNSSGDVIVNQTVKFKFSILQNSSTGTPVYVETQSATTNDFGLANLVIGEGTKLSGDLNPSEWGSNTHFLKVELDPNNGNSFRHLGTTQLLAVPYAFHAETVENAEDSDADPTNEIQDLQLSGTVLGLSGSSKTVNLPSSNGGERLWQENENNIYYNLGNVGIGTATPKANLHINSDDGILVQGTLGSGTVQNLGQGYRMHYYLKKGAFRVGYASASEWDDANIGEGSIAMGSGVLASGNYSTAIGFFTKATALQSMALGSSSEASGINSIALGNVTSASGDGATALGYLTEASGLYSTALGSGIEASGDYSVAISLDYVSDNITQDNTMAIMGGKVGIGTVTPGSILHLKQAGNGFKNGLRLERPDNTNWWSIQINNYNDLVFDYKGTNTRAWIEHATAEYHYVSDLRLKTDINPIECALSRVMQLNPVTFRFKTNLDSDKPSYGLIAQEVEKIYPEFVSENNGNLGIAYHNFSVVNIKAIQEQQEQIGLMKKQIENLVNQNNELKSNNERIINKLEKLESQFKELQSHILLTNNNKFNSP
jgi:hypothetical protein